MTNVTQSRPSKTYFLAYPRFPAKNYKNVAKTTKNHFKLAKCNGFSFYKICTRVTFDFQVEGADSTFRNAMWLCQTT